jgi:peptidoglycan/xylan/chitin deacetylase (PgdA/CDA1 family)
MKTRYATITILGSLIICLLMTGPAQAQPKEESSSVASSNTRLVAVTIDDLPVVGGHDLQRKQEITTKLLAQLADLKMPAIGFVVEQKLGEPVAGTDHIALLEQWLDAGHYLGNHTYSHPSLYDTPLAEYEQDVLRGEVVTRQLLGKHNKEMRYFRHPYLNTGPDLAAKTAFEQFLMDHNYAIAPVTIDSDEYIYALAFDKAVAAEDSTLAMQVGSDYIRYMEEMFIFYEQLSRDLLGREPAQILLLHANALNADHMDELAGMMRKRGYEFTSLEMALQDPAYALPDHYAGKSGLSWLQRWWITQGNERRKEPDVPEWVREIAYPSR